MRPRGELQQAVAHLDGILERLRARESELAASTSTFDQLAMHEVRIDVAHRTRVRLGLEQELIEARIAELKQEMAIGSARKMLGPAPAKKGAPQPLASALAKAEAEHAVISAQHDGLAAVIAERTREWADFRAANHEALRDLLGEESEALRDEMAVWMAQRSVFEQRWRALDRRYAAINRSSYATGTSQGGDLPAFPLKLTGQPVRPIPQSVAPPAGVRAAGR
jgi:hypothetical protein